MKNDIDKLVIDINAGKHAQAKDLLEKILKDKCAKKIADVLKEQED